MGGARGDRGEADYSMWLLLCWGPADDAQATTALGGKGPARGNWGAGHLNLALKDGQDSRGLSVGTREERKHRHGERAQSPGWGLQ